MDKISGSKISKKQQAILKKQILEELQTPRSRGYLTRTLKLGKWGLSQKAVLGLIDGLKKDGYPIEFAKAGNRYYLRRDPRSQFGIYTPGDFKNLVTGSCRGMYISDDHLGSDSSQLHLLPIINNVAEKEKVDFISHSGDLFSSINARQPSKVRGDNRLQNSDEQEELAFRQYGDVKKPFYIRPGNHDEWVWLSCGHNMVYATVNRLRNEAKMHNVHYISAKEPWFTINNVVIELSHPSKGQTKTKAYGPTNAVTKRLGSIGLEIRSRLKQAGDKIKANGKSGSRLIVPVPSSIAIGNMHTCVSYVYAGIALFLVPCLQKQTSWERKKELWHQMGAWVFDISINKLGRVSHLMTKYYAFDHLAREHTAEEIKLHSDIHEEIVANAP